MSTKPEFAERNARIVEMYRAGATLQAVGDAFNVTRQRVKQIVSEETGDGLRRRTPTNLRRDIDTAALVSGYLAGDGLNDLEAKFDLSKTAIRRRLLAAGVKMRPLGRVPNSERAEQIEQMRASGMKWREIADALGLKSKGSVHSSLRAKNRRHQRAA